MLIAVRVVRHILIIWKMEGLLEAQPKEFTQQVFDPQKGTIDLSTGNVSSVLTFITPTFTQEKKLEKENRVVNMNI